MKKILLACLLLCGLIPAAYAYHKHKVDEQIIAALAIVTPIPVDDPDSPRDYCDADFGSAYPPWLYQTYFCPSGQMDAACGQACVHTFNLNLSGYILQACNEMTLLEDLTFNAYDDASAQYNSCIADGHDTLYCAAQQSEAINAINNNYYDNVKAINFEFDNLVSGAYVRLNNCLQSCCVPPEPVGTRPHH